MRNLASDMRRSDALCACNAEWCSAGAVENSRLIGGSDGEEVM